MARCIVVDSDPTFKRLVEFELLVIGLVSLVLLLTFNVHGAIAVVGAIVVVGVARATWKTKIGFIVWSTVSSIMWGSVGYSIAHHFGDWIWGVVVGIFVALVAAGAHLGDKDKS